MGQIISLNNDGIINLIHRLTELYHDGELEGLVVGVKMKNGEFATGTTNSLSFLEKMGLAQAIVNDTTYIANEGD